MFRLLHNLITGWMLISQLLALVLLMGFLSRLAAELVSAGAITRARAIGHDH